MAQLWLNIRSFYIWSGNINKALAPYLKVNLLWPFKIAYYSNPLIHRKEIRKLTESFPGRFLVGDLCFDSDLCLALSFSLSLSLSFLSLSRSISDSGESFVNKGKILNINITCVRYQFTEYQHFREVWLHFNIGHIRKKLLEAVTSLTHPINQGRNKSFQITLLKWFEKKRREF